MKLRLFFLLALLTGCVTRPATQAVDAPRTTPSSLKLTVPAMEVQQALLKATNAARAVPRKCGGQSFAAAKPLVLNQRLSAAAQRHALDMTTRNFFEHQGSDGSNVAIRSEAMGYDYRLIGENLAGGYKEAQTAIAGWIKSEGHCKNLMNPDYRELGVGYAENLDTEYRQYWVQVMGLQR